MAESYEKIYTVHSYECDQNFNLTLPNLVNYMQEMALLHSDECGCSYKYMSEIGFAWILYKWKIRVYRYPSIGEQLKVKTWSSGMDRLYAYRSFRIFDKEGKIVCEALSIWLVLDLNQRTVTSIPQIIKEKYRICDEYVFKNDFKNNPVNIAADEISSTPYTVRMHDIDYNGHMNNVKYIEIFLDSLPTDITASKSFYDLEVTYKKECVLGDALDCICFNSQGNTEADTREIISAVKKKDIDNIHHANAFFKLILK